MSNKRFFQKHQPQEDAQSIEPTRLPAVAIQLLLNERYRAFPVNMGYARFPHEATDENGDYWTVGTREPQLTEVSPVRASQRTRLRFKSCSWTKAVST